jgi:hypothetical protein
VFSTASGVATGLPMSESNMNDKNYPTSANLGVFVVLGIVPIVVYVIMVLVLPLILRRFH